ncbi:MAG TPA: sugar ABC transporter permease, partial [Candidatus Ozemobacteraceae bacterium]|nr:sugar ABC transporter permease [Candidatus Ozemobacteraceae bacterium]
LYEAAAVDGAEDWHCFRHIILPQMKPMILFVLVINSIRTWQVFPEVFILTRGSPLGTTDTIVHRLYETAFRFHDLGYASAMAWTLTLLLLLLSWLKTRALRDSDR